MATPYAGGYAYLLRSTSATNTASRSAYCTVCNTALFFDGMACQIHCPNVVYVVVCNIYAYIYAFIASYILVIIEKYWQNDLILMFLTTILLAPRTMLSKMKEFLWKTKGIC